MSSRDIARLRERSTEIRTRMSAINDAHPDGSLGDDGAEWTRLDTEATGLEEALSRRARVEELERRAAAVPADGGTGDSRFDQLAAQVSFLDVVRAQMPGISDKGTGRAIEVSRELEIRAGKKTEGLYFSMSASGRRESRAVGQISTVNALGGFLIEEEIQQQPIDRLREKLIVSRLGSTVLGGLQGDLYIPRLTGSATTFWIGDGQPVPQSNLTFDNIGLFMKTLGALTSISRGMILQPSLDVARFAQDDMTRVLAVALDKAAINGTGTNAQPHGLLGNTDVGNSFDVSGNGGDPTWNRVIGAIQSVDQANALMGSLGWATNANVVSKLRRVLKTTTDTASNFIMDDASTLAGYPLLSSQVVPNNLTRGTSVGVCSPLIFGDWSSIVIGTWDPISVMLNPYDSVAYAAGSVLVRCLMSVDINIRHGQSFGVLADLTTV